MKKIISLLLVMIMALGVLAGCTQKTDKSGERVLTVGIPQDSTIPDYDTNAFIVWLEEQTKIDIELVFFANSASDYGRQIALQCSAGEALPDVMIGFNQMSHYTVNQFGEDGFFLDLSELIEEHAPNYKKAIAGLDKEMQDYIKEKGTNTTDGKSFYAMPSLELEYADNLQTMAYINQTWLDNLGLQKPTNVSELMAVCEAFMTQDPNKNGEDDEIAMLGDFTPWIMNAFIEYDTSNFNVKDGKVWDPIYTDEWRQGMQFVNSLVKKGYYNELSFTLKTPERQKLIAPLDGVSQVGMFTGHHESMTKTNPDVMADFVALDPLADETGKGGYTIINPVEPKWGTFITSECTNPELAMELIDIFYTDEAVTRQRHGEKDVDWVYEEGTNVQGSTSYTKAINMDAFFDKTTNKTIGNMVYIMTEWNYLVVEEGVEGRAAEAARLQKEQWAVLQNAKERESVTHLIYNTEEYDARELKAGGVSSYIGEQSVLFAKGEQDISKDSVWNTFKATLTELGREELMKVAQSAMDRKSK